MKIQHVITTLDVGGAEVHLLAQVRGQVQRGHRVRVAYLKGAGSLRPEFLEAGAEEVLRVGLWGSGGLWRRIRAAQIIHSHLLKADMLAALMAGLAGATHKLIASKHNDERALLNPLFARIHGILGNLPRRTIILSKHVLEFFVSEGRLKREKLVQVYYGLDPAPFGPPAEQAAGARAQARADLGLGEQDCVLICVARFAPQKRHDLLLESFAKARQEFKGNLRLLLVGGDPFGEGRAQAEAVAGDLGLGDAVLFLGIRRDVPDLYRLADVFVMYSEWEGLGLVFLEAMAAGLPVVATDVSAVSEVVLDGETGCLVPFGDTAAMAAAWVALASDSAAREALGQAGQERVTTAFGLDRMVDATLAVYEQVRG